MTGGKRPRSGRKAVNIDLEQLEKLCSLQCTDDELASVLGVSVRTIERRKNQSAFAEAMVTAELDVPLMVTRGYPSISYLHAAAEAILQRGKPAFLYYFGDYDPSGCDITRAVESGIREFAPKAEIHFTRVAVTPDQIQKLRLPTRPTKKSDSRSRNFEGDSVEVDAIPPSTLRLMVRHSIEAHIDRDELGRLQVIENAERETLRRIAENYRLGSGIESRRIQ